MPNDKGEQGKMNAKKILLGILAGEKKKDIAVEAGSIAKSTQAKITAVNRKMNSKEYKDLSMKLVDKLQKEIDALIEAMLLRNKDTVEYKDMASALDKLIKNKELISGGVTERKEITTEELQDFLNRSK